MENQAMTEEEEFEFRLRYEGEQKPDTSGWQEYEPLAADKTANILGTRTGSVVKGATSLLTGPFQLGANIGDKLSEWTGEEDPWVGDYVNQKLKQWEDKKNKGRKARGSEGFDWWEMGGLAGSPMNLMKTGVVKAPQITAGGEKVAKALTTKMLEGSKAGALYGTGMPVVDGGEDFFKTKGAQAGAGAGMGAAVPPIVAGGKLTGNIIDDATRPLRFRNTPGNWYSKTGAMPGIVKDTRDYMVEAAGEGKNKIIEALRRAKPGQTSRQALAAQSRQGDVVGSPFIKLEDDISKRVATSDVAKSVYAQQEAERAAAIGGIAKSQAERVQARADRMRTSNKNYGDAYQQKVKVTKKVPRVIEPKPTGIVDVKGNQILSPERTVQVTKIEKELTDLLKDPFLRKSLSTANNLAKSEGISLKSNPTQYLHFVKIGIDKQLRKTGDDALSNTEKRAAKKIQDKLVEYIGKKNPVYDSARTTHAKQSIPINRMQVGKELEKGLINAKEAESAGPFLTAIRESPRTVKRGTKFDYGKLDDVLSPDQMKSVNKVTDELLTNEAATKIASKTRSAYPALTEEAKLQIAPMLERNVMIANALMRRVARNVTPEYEKVAWDIMKNPQKMADLLKTNPEKAKSVMEYIKRMSILGPTSAATQGAN
jgi:hypothetical protein